MKYWKKGWLGHYDDKKVGQMVFSIHVSPDGDRLATAGVDGKIRIWSTSSILSPNDDPTTPKQLCSMSTHNGAVTCVRFSPDGRYLASGSDDKIVMIWERDTSGVGLGKVFGSNETNVENWRCTKRLVGHENDIQDLAWSHDGSLLVTVGLDSLIMIWSSPTFTRLRTLKSHQSHIKGITFDPASRYFATSSDDRSVRIIRTSDFGTEAVLSEPFKNSSIGTYFRRVGWSPEGGFLGVGNAMNGPVTCARVVQRGTWNSDLSLIGHEGPVEVMSFSPIVYKKEQHKEATDANTYCITASAGQDKRLALWSTERSRPIFISDEVSEKSISDIAWSPDGLTLFGASYDGSIVMLRFERGELGVACSKEEVIGMLGKYGHGMRGVVYPESTEQLEREERTDARELQAKGKGGGDVMMSDAPQAPTVFVPPVTAAVVPVPAQQIPAKPLQQKITVTKDGRKRVAPQLLTTISGGGHAAASALPQPVAVAQSSSAGGGGQRVIDLSEPSAQLPPGGVKALLVGNKRKLDAAIVPTGGAARVENEEWIRPAIVNPATTVSQIRLGVPKVISVLSHDGGDPDATTTLEARNGRGEGEPTRLNAVKRGILQWTDYTPRSILLLTSTPEFYAAACEDGSVLTWSRNGMRLLPPIVLESQPVFLEGMGAWMMCVTSVGMVHVWNLTTFKAAHPPISLAPVLDAAVIGGTEVRRAPALTRASVTDKGAAVITLTDGDAFTYAARLQSWLRVSESWWMVGSQYWDASGMLRSRLDEEKVGIVAMMERRTDEAVMRLGRGRVLNRIVKAPVLMRKGFEGFEMSVSVSHLENRLGAACVLGSKEEYRTTLITYVKRLASEGLKEKLEELFKGLLGPTAYAEKGDWEPTVAGNEKRKLLREAIEAIGKHREFQRLMREYEEALGELQVDGAHAMEILKE
ncbi:HIR complex subunit [Saitoella coloradoensis]